MSIAKGNIRQLILEACEGDFSPEQLVDCEQLFCQLSFLVAAYAREDPKSWPAKHQHPPTNIPHCLADPLINAGKRLGMEPILCYASTVTYNARLVDASKPASLDNLDIVYTFTGSVDEQWFYILGAAIELLSPRALQLGWQILHRTNDTGDVPERSFDGDEEVASVLYKKLEAIICESTSLLKRMYDNNHAGYFFDKIRHYLAGWHNDTSVGEGKRHYETSKSIDAGALQSIEIETPTLIDMSHLAGASAAQSPTIQLFDAILGVEHENDFLRGMQCYMPANQRACLQWYHGRFQQFYASNRAITGTAAYRRCREALLAFRKTHWFIVQHYIVAAAKQPTELKGMRNGKSAEAQVIGTGGTNAVALLQELMDDTVQ